MREMRFSSSSAKFLWFLHGVRLRVALSNTPRDIRNSIVAGVNQLALEAYQESDTASEIERLTEAFNRLGSLEVFLPELVAAHDLRLSEINFAHVLKAEGWLALTEEVLIASARLVIGAVLTLSGVVMSLFAVAATFAPKRFGVFRTAPDTYELRLMSSVPADGSLLNLWILLVTVLVGLFVTRAGLISLYRTILRSIAKSSNVLKPWSEQ